MALTIIARGRTTLAKLVKRGDLWLAVGSGAASWPVPTPPPVADAAVGLVTPLALVRCVASDYVTPTLGTPAFRTDDGQGWAYSANGAATPHLCLDFRLAPADLADHALREMMLVLDPVFSAAPAAGQRVVPIAAVADFGDPVGIDHTAPMWRAGVDETLRIVVTP